MPEFIYQMRGVRKAHGDKVIFDNVTLAFLPGAKIGVLGRNGSGKSTLLRIMAGQDKDFDGEAKLTDGFTAGYLSQEPRLNPEKNVQGNVDEAVAGTRAVLQRFDAINARLGSMHLRLGTSAEALEFVDQTLRRCSHILERQADDFHAILTRMIEDEIAGGRLALADDVAPAELAEALTAMARGVNARLPQPKAETLLGTYTRNTALLLRGASHRAAAE